MLNPSELPTLILRSETKPGERRTPLLPSQVARLVERGARVWVETSPERIFPEAEYAAAGARLVPPGTWRATPTGTIVLGLKELPEDSFPLPQTHAYFAHCYKGQVGADAVLSRFRVGGGRLYDLEFLVGEYGRRIAAFGYWAGFVGAAVAVKTWIHRRRNPDLAMPALRPWESVEALFGEILDDLAEFRGELPTAVVTGHRGRSGSGAYEFFRGVGLNFSGYDREETARGGAFTEWLDLDLLVHCIGTHEPGRPFLEAVDLARADRRLSVVSDVTCDVGGALHRLPFYESLTTLDEPVRSFVFGGAPLDVIAIDHLPTLLPRESSEEFAAALFPYLEAWLPWHSAESEFRRRVEVTL